MRTVLRKLFDYFLIFIFISPLQNCVKAQTKSSAVVTYTKLVWQDEFDNPGQPDPAKWNYDTGYIRNHELQYYTHNREENARVSNGMLDIVARNDSFISN